MPTEQQPQQPPGAMNPREAAPHVEALLDDDGHFNPDDQVSRAHPDYDESQDERAQPPDRERDSRGRYKKAAESEGEDEQEQLEAAGDDQDEDTQPGDTDEDLAASADEDAEANEEDTGSIESLAELAEALGTDVEEVLSALSHTFNAAGEEATVTLSELVKGYQKDADYRRSTAKLADDRKKADMEFQGRHQQYDQANHFLSSQLQIAEMLVGAELEDPRLAELRVSDPGEWTARREEIGGRLQKLRDARTQAAAAYVQFVQQVFEQNKAQHLEALNAAVPDFGEEHRNKAKGLFESFGFASQEIDQIIDHRMILGALELADLRQEVAELRKLKEEAENTAKRIKKDVPKLTRPGKQERKPVGDALNRQNVVRLRKRAKKSGSVEDAAAVIEATIL